MKIFSCISIAYIALLAGSYAQPVNKIDEVLAQKLEQMRESDFTQLIILLDDQVDVRAMDRSLRLRRAGKDERHRLVVTALQEMSERSQSDLRADLSERSSQGEVLDVRPMWIVNMIVAKATKRAIQSLSMREDIRMIYEDGPLILDTPVEESDAPTASPGSAEPGLRAINAHKLWELGYHGEGSIVMNIDTGVEGSHPAFAARWRGNQPGVPWYHAWFDQMNTPSPVPVDYGSSDHGTHTMGIMTGLETATNDTIGVAPGALWIASPTIDVGFSPHTSYTLAAFQWAADPDSNINTSDDVPDAISNSYQDPNVSASECSGAAGYWVAIDAVEAIGTAVVFSAGNSGPGASTITPPKNRITTAVNIFAVGNINVGVTPYIISSSSSRGPSKCDNTTIKPEVVAPGTSVRSAIGTNTYGTKSGTSMASPHVAGAIAVLRGANPALTGTEIKEILYSTAVDYGVPGEDNAYGNGLIDMWAAFQLVSVAAPRIEGIVTEAGTGDTLSGVTVQNITSGATVSTDQSGFFRFILADTGSYVLQYSKLGYETALDTVHAPDDSTTYNANQALVALPAPQIAVGPSNILFSLSPGDSAMTTLSVGNAGPVNSQLAYQLALNGGFGGLLEETIGGPISAFTGGARIRGNRYAVERATTLKEIQSYHVIPDSTEMRFVVYESTTPTGTFSLLYDGPPRRVPGGTQFASSGPINVALDSGKYYMIGAGWLESVTYYNGASFPLAVGFGQALSGVSISAYPPPASISITSTTTTLYHGAISSTSGKFITLIPAEGDTIGGSVTNTHNVRIATSFLDPGTHTAGIIVDSNDPSQPSVMVPVEVQIVTTGIIDGHANIPAQFVLHQNFPNPFNPVTTIRYDVPIGTHVTLKLYDLLGREVRTLVNDQVEAGYYAVSFDGSSLASGVYYYRLATDQLVFERKLMLLK